MKNASLTKTLLCGVMATTFFLINCQKAPSRGIKAQNPGGGSITTPDGKTAAQDVVVACSPAFLSAYKASTEATNNLAKKAKELTNEATNSEKEALIAEEKVVRSKIEDTVAEITKVQSNATACKFTNDTTKKDETVTIASIKGTLDRINLDLKAKNVETEGLAETQERLAQAAERRKQAQAKNSVEGLAQNMQFNVSDKLAEQLKKANVGGAIYFKAGNIIDKPSQETLEKDRKDTSLSMCELGEGSGDVEKGEKAKVTSIDMASSKDVQSKRYKLLVTMEVKSVLINFDCLISDAEAVKKESGKAFRNVFGKNLMTDANLEAEKKKADAKKVTVDQAKAELAKREEAVTAQDTAITNKEGVLSEKEVQLMEATTAKDDAKVKALTEEVAQLKASIESLKKDLEKLKKLSAEAKSALEKAEKESAA
jgi:hypothetical protein